MPSQAGCVKMEGHREKAVEDKDRDWTQATDKQTAKIASQPPGASKRNGVVPLQTSEGGVLPRL